MLQQLFETQRGYLNNFLNKLDFAAAEQMLQLMLGCQGVIFFTGVGKSGIIAQKLAVTMASTGTRALFLTPTDAMHGDLGIVSNKDVFIFLSKSGESDEILNLVPHVRNKGAYLASWVSNPNSRLSRACDFSLNLPLERELCPFDLAPTTSAAIQLVFGDVLTVALMRAKGFTLDDYAQNHPQGRIGKRMVMRVKDLMLQGEALPLCRPGVKLVDALVELSSKRCGCLLVVDDAQVLQGIFTDGDLRRALQFKGATVLESSLEALMSRTPRKTAPEVLAWEAMRLMEEDQKRPITTLPVVDGKRLVGLIKMHDILQAGL